MRLGRRPDDQELVRCGYVRRGLARRVLWPEQHRLRTAVPAGAAANAGGDPDTAGHRRATVVAARALELERQRLCLAARRIRPRRRPRQSVPDRVLGADRDGLALGTSALDVVAGDV